MQITASNALQGTGLRETIEALDKGQAFILNRQEEKQMELELIRELSISKWGFWIDTYFFDFYLHTRTIITALIIAGILRARKVIKDKRRKS